MIVKPGREWEKHLDLHEAKREKFGLPSLEEQDCAHCRRGLEVREERLAKS